MFDVSSLEANLVMIQPHNANMQYVLKTLINIKTRKSKNHLQTFYLLHKDNKKVTTKNEQH